MLKTAILIVIDYKGFIYHEWIVMHQLQFMTNFKFLVFDPLSKNLSQFQGTQNFGKKT